MWVPLHLTEVLFLISWMVVAEAPGGAFDPSPPLSSLLTSVNLWVTLMCSLVER